MKTLLRWLMTLCLVFFSTPGEAQFSDGLLSHLLTLDHNVLTKGKTLSLKEVHDIWDRMDQETFTALNALDSKMKASDSEKKLNEAFQWKKIIEMDKKGEEIEEMELGAIEIKFFSLGNHEWLAQYYHGVGISPTSTFRIFKKDKTGYQIKYKMEDVLPNKEPLAAIEQSALQIQILPKPPESVTVRFSTIHQGPARGSRSNRSQIVWEKERELKPVYWYPQVDWHTVEEKIVEGRGPGEPL